MRQWVAAITPPRYSTAAPLRSLSLDSSCPDHSAATTCIDDGDNSPSAPPSPPMPPTTPPLPILPGSTTLAATTRRALERGEYVRRRGEWFDMTEAGTAAGKEPEAGSGEGGEVEEAAMDDSEVNDADNGNRG